MPSTPPTSPAPAPASTRVVLALSAVRSRSWLFPAVVTLLVVVLRAWQLGHRTFYWDDFVIPAKYIQPPSQADLPELAPLTPLPGDSGLSALWHLFTTGSFWTGLFQAHDSHVMPASILLQVVVHALAPLSWTVPLLIILIATAAAGWAWWAALTAVNAPTWTTHIAFTVIMFSPYLMGASGWWSAAINALAWNITFALALRVVLTSRNPLALAGILALGLLFTEKTLSIPPLLVVIAAARALIPLSPTQRQPLPRRIVEAVRPLFVTLIVWVIGAIGYVKLVAAAPPAPLAHLATDTAAAAAEFRSSLPAALMQGLATGIIGGPVTWDRWHPSNAFANPPAWLAALCTGLLVGAAVWWVACLGSRVPTGARARLIRAAAVTLAVSYVGVIVAAMARLRSGEATTDLLARTPHYFADSWTAAVVLILVAHALTTPLPSAQPRQPATQRYWPWVAGAYIAMFAMIAATSTVTWTRTWANDPAIAYAAQLAQARPELARSPYLDQQVPYEILIPLMAPYNRVSSLTSTQPAAEVATPLAFTDSGERRPGEVFAFTRNRPGLEPKCGHRIAAGQAGVIPLATPVYLGNWVWELNAAATSPVSLRITTPNPLEPEDEVEARATSVAVGKDLATRYAAVAGGGGLLRVEVTGPAGASVCIGEGAFGPLVPRTAASR